MAEVKPFPQSSLESMVEGNRTQPAKPAGRWKGTQEKVLQQRCGLGQSYTKEQQRLEEEEANRRTEGSSHRNNSVNTGYLREWINHGSY